MKKRENTFVLLCLFKFFLNNLFPFLKSVENGTQVPPLHEVLIQMHVAAKMLGVTLSSPVLRPQVPASKPFGR